MRAQPDPSAYGRLAERFATAGKLSSARMVLWWDSQTYMPKAAAATRGEQFAVIDQIASDMLTDPVLSDWVSEAQQGGDDLGPEAAANLREMSRVLAHTLAVPRELRAAKSRLSATLQVAWLQAKQENDFSLFAPGFREMLLLHREIGAAKAAALGLEPYDALMDEMDPGVTTALAEPIFDRLEQSLPGLLAEAAEVQAGLPAARPFSGDFSVERQRALSQRLLAALGQTSDRARIDEASHPFALPGNPGDGRITTRFDPGNFRFAVMATLHESGHAAYESNLPRSLAFQPAGAARGATPHESQSLMLEMLAGRSREFLTWLAPVLHKAFGGEAAAWTPENLVRAYRKVGDGFIRVEADEISYPLHVILRYRIERALLSGDLDVDDIPGAWSDLSLALFGRAPPDHARGALQDIHWAAGMFAYFPNYALGAALASQLFEAATIENGAILPALGRGDFGPYFDWVKPRVQERASLVPFETLVSDATGASLSADALQRHLRRRYVEEAGAHG